MKINIFPFLIIIPTLFFLSGCVTPEPISLLKGTEEQQRFWHQGQEFLTQSKGGITVELTYDREVGDYYVFDMGVYNESETELNVDPEKYFYRPVMMQKDSMKIVKAENPEEHLLEIDKKLSRLQAEEINQSISSALLTTAEITMSVAAEVSDMSQDKKNEMYRAHQEDRFYRSYQAAEIEYDQLDTQQQREYWKTQTLRKTTLLPDNYITGKTFFRKTLKADEVILYLPLNDEIFSFKYNQKLVEVE
ncbi:hypothetical protein [Gracilimonas sp.]|uniref:hypothetical protein n=1 Tax=Gracilimonas sp. TaxID=1974203 RepID=UPI0032EC45E4